MSIDNKLRQIIQIKSDIKDAIVDKGVEMPAGLPFNQYASKVSEISGGGGESPKREDVNIYTTNANELVTDDGIYIRPSDNYMSMLANSYNDSTTSIPLEKPLTHYEVNIKLLPMYIKDSIFGIICWRGFDECGFKSYVTSNSSYSTHVAKRSYETSIGNTLTCSYLDAISIKYTFDNSLVTVKFGSTESNTITTTYTPWTNPTNITSVSSMGIYGDTGDSSQAANRLGKGLIFFKGTYIRDLDTGNIVWELCNGYNK